MTQSIAASTNSNQSDSPQEWDLSDLYQGFNDPKLEQDLESLQTAAAEFRNQFRGKVKALMPDQLAACFKTLEAIAEKSGYLYTFPSLIFSADTRNTEAKQFLDKVTEALTGVENQLLFFDLELQKLEAGQFDTLQNSAVLEPYRHYLSQIAKYRPHTLT